LTEERGAEEGGVSSAVLHWRVHGRGP
jgi:hypothetical protein